MKRFYAILSLVTLFVFLVFVGISSAEGSMTEISTDNSYVDNTDNSMEIIGGSGNITIITNNSGTITIGQIDPATGETEQVEVTPQIAATITSPLWICGVRITNPYPVSKSAVLMVNGVTSYNIIVGGGCVYSFPASDICPFGPGALILFTDKSEMLLEVLTFPNF